MPIAGEGTYTVLASRHRAGAATSAVDISMVHGEEVVSPVTGTVTAVSPYSLYGRTPDVIIEIVPEDRPDQVVRAMHVEGVDVAVGDRVEAGETTLAASARQLPFASQIDRFAGRHPHLHLEVQPSG
jgi:biotin carboxyl carrier protein